MGRRYGPFVAAYTAVSVCSLAWRIKSSFPKPYHSLSEEVIAASGLFRHLFQSSLNTLVMLNIVLNFFILASLITKAIFFGTLSILEVQKLVERLINYVIFKGLFLALVAQPDTIQIALWLVWFAVLGFLKVFQGLAKDRLERLNASPTATLFEHGRVFAVLVLVLFADLFWIQLCIYIFKSSGINTLLLLLFEPFSIVFDTLQAVLVHGMQLQDTWYRHTRDMAPECAYLQPSQRSAAAAAWEWRGIMVQNCSFIMDVVSLLLSLGHCLHIWWLRGLAFKVVDGVLFLNLRTILSAILKRIKGFLRMRAALSTLQGALPDATEEELLAYDDDCAICKEPMARAKQLPCTHLFHLPCLRSWLDQGLAEAYSCPTCRRPLFMGRTCPSSTSQRRQQLDDGNLTIRTPTDDGGSGTEDMQTLDDISQRGESNSGIRPFMGQQWNTSLQHNNWSDAEGQFRWTDPFHRGTSLREDPLSTGARQVGPMQTIMQRITGQQRGHSPSGSSEASWSWWPFPHRITQVSSSVDEHGQDIAESPYQSVRQGLQVNFQMRAMVNTVREVLPDTPEEIILQDLLRTNSVTTTVNNLL